jgi:hypothetical protein
MKHSRHYYPLDVEEAIPPFGQRPRSLRVASVVLLFSIPWIKQWERRRDFLRWILEPTGDAQGQLLHAQFGPAERRSVLVARIS